VISNDGTSLAMPAVVAVKNEEGQSSFPLLTSSMSSRRNNLDTIVEAIRHLEGEQQQSLARRIKLQSPSDDSTAAALAAIFGSSGQLTSCEDELILDEGVQNLLRSDDIFAMPTVAAFEQVSDGLCTITGPNVLEISYASECASLTGLSEPVFIPLRCSNLARR